MRLIVGTFFLLFVGIGWCTDEYVDGICYWKEQDTSIVDITATKPTYVPVVSGSFEISSTELTILQYKACVESGGYVDG